MPYKSTFQLEPEYQKAVKGYYLKYELFKTLEHKDEYFYIPAKKDWGINPQSNKDWYTFQEIENQLSASIKENQSVLCWQKYRNTYTEFFIVWW